MNNIKIRKETFNKHGGVLKTSELNALGLSSREIKRLIKDNVIVRIKHGFYELTNYFPRQEVIISRLFPEAVIFLESAMMEYSFTDRMPSAWEIAVNKDSNKKQYEIAYPFIEPYYLEAKFIEIDGIDVRIYDRDRTICDTLRYEKNLKEKYLLTQLKII